eukprot:7332986-Alexandrium_andersonii.AAC.1
MPSESQVREIRNELSMPPLADPQFAGRLPGEDEHADDEPEGPFAVDPDALRRSGLSSVQAQMVSETVGQGKGKGNDPSPDLRASTPPPPPAPVARDRASSADKGGKKGNKRGAEGPADGDGQRGAGKKGRGSAWGRGKGGKEP